MNAMWVATRATVSIVRLWPCSTREVIRMVSPSYHQVGANQPIASSTTGADDATTIQATTYHGRASIAGITARPSTMPQISTGVSTNGPAIRDMNSEVMNVEVSEIHTIGRPRR